MFRLTILAHGLPVCLSKVECCFPFARQTGKAFLVPNVKGGTVATRPAGRSDGLLACFAPGDRVRSGYVLSELRLKPQVVGVRIL